jgi:hypothetical protein
LETQANPEGSCFRRGRVAKLDGRKSLLISVHLEYLRRLAGYTGDLMNF